MKKNLLNSNFKFFKFFDKNNIGSIPRIFLSSIILVTAFYYFPAISHYITRENVEFQNKEQVESEIDFADTPGEIIHKSEL